MVTSLIGSLALWGSLLWPRRARKAARPGVYGGNGGVSSIEQLARHLARSRVRRKRSPGAAQSFHKRAGSVDFRPVQRAKLVVFLRLDHCSIGIGGVLRAPADAGDSGRKIGGQKQAP